MREKGDRAGGSAVGRGQYRASAKCVVGHLAGGVSHFSRHVSTCCHEVLLLILPQQLNLKMIEAVIDCGVLLCAAVCCCCVQVVKVLNLEEGGAFTVSSADTILEALA